MNQTWKKNLRNIAPYVPGEQSKKKNIIKLNANENPYPPSPKAIEAMKAFDCDRLRQYPNSSADELKIAAAKHFGLKKEQVFVGNGSDEVIAMAFLGCFNSEKPILFPDITYSFYPVWCSLFETPYQTVPVQEDFTINPSDYFVENGGIILPNPNAPTSIGEGETFLRQVLDHNQDSVVIIDEAYVDFGGYSALPLLKEYENLLIIHTFSKSRSLAGIRVGMALGNETIINTLEAIKNSYNSYTIDSIGMALATASIGDEAYFEKTTEKIMATRQRVAIQLRELGFSLCDSQTNFLFVTHPTASAKEIFQYLKERDIFIRHFNLPRIENHLRITIGTDEEMDTLVAEIKNYLKK